MMIFNHYLIAIRRQRFIERRTTGVVAVRATLEHVRDLVSIISLGLALIDSLHLLMVTFFLHIDK